MTDDAVRLARYRRRSWAIALALSVAVWVGLVLAAVAVVRHLR